MKFEEALKELRAGKTIVSRFNTIKPDGFYEIDLAECMEEDWEARETEWHPKHGAYNIASCGSIQPSSISQQKVEGAKFGMYRSTIDLAEKARDKMRAFNRLLAYVDEQLGDNPSKREWGIVYDDVHKEFAPFCVARVPLKIPYGIYMTESVAIQLCKDLNSGRVKL